MSVSAQFRTHSTPSSTRLRYDLPGVACLVSSADRCSVSSVRACVPVRGVACLASGTACPAACDVQAVRVSWGMGSPPAGYTAAAQPRPVSPVTTEKIKKAQKITPTLIVNLKNSAEKTKRPLQRVCVLCYTCLTNLEREESAMNQKNDKNKEKREKNEKIAASIWGIIIGAALLAFGVYLMAHGISNAI